MWLWESLLGLGWNGIEYFFEVCDSFLENMYVFLVIDWKNSLSLTECKYFEHDFRPHFMEYT